MSEELNADRLTKIYVKIREKRRELKKQDDALEEQINIIASELLDICKQQGSSLIRTPHGTISRRTTKRYWTADWHSFFEFIKEHDAFALMHQRINTANMEQFLEENPDLHPPGLNADQTQTVVIVKK
jgi:hypothetical protein